jgi:hypothetical protein
VPLAATRHDKQQELITCKITEHVCSKLRLTAALTSLHLCITSYITRK